MKARLKNIMIFIALCLPKVGIAQINLVLNPSFENYSACPTVGDEAKYAYYWMSLDSAWNPPDWAHDPNGVPDFCHTCSTHGQSSVPTNNHFFRYPHTGNAMMQVQCFSYIGDTGQAKDYLQGHLTQTLITGHKYFVQFYVTSEQRSGFAINNIGAYFDNGSIDTTRHPGATQNQYIPQIVDTNIVNDTLNWIKIEGTFTANGTEKLLTIGVFSDVVHTKIDTISGGYSWYLIDDVSVIDCDNIPFAGRDTLIHPGDSAWIGPHESLLPYTWYKLGSSTAIDSGGGTWVKPTVTTTYILEQKLCGRLRYDTVKVRVWPDTSLMVNGELFMVNVRVYPNPVADEVTIEVASAKGLAMTGFDVVLYDVVGREIYKGIVNDKLLIVNVESLPKGIYFVQVMDRETSVKLVKKVLKE